MPVEREFGEGLKPVRRFPATPEHTIIPATFVIPAPSVIPAEAGIQQLLGA